MAQQRKTVARSKMHGGLQRDSRAVSQEMAHRFAAEYLIDLNATQAYKRAKGEDVKDNTAATMGSLLLRNAKVQALVQAGARRQQATAELSAVRVLEELRRLAFFDVADFFDNMGRLKALKDIAPAARAVIAGIEVARANLDRTDGKRSSEWLHKIKLSPKVNALEMLAKHFKLLDRAGENENGMDWDKYLAAVNRARQKLVADKADKAKKGR